MNNDLRELKDIVDRNSENDFNILNEKKEEIDKRWNEMFSKLAYYIEHDELEKFAKNLENIKTYIEEEEYGECKKEINEGIYILEHIEAKYSFDLQNIF